MIYRPFTKFNALSKRNAILLNKTLLLQPLCIHSNCLHTGVYPVAHPVIVKGDAYHEHVSTFIYLFI